MRSRGTLFDVGAGARRSFALLGTALILCSLFLQYLSLAAPAAVLAVHDDSLFELDGNSANDGAVTGDDWDSHPGASGNRFVFVTDPLSQVTDEIFTIGSTKDDLDLTGWHWTTGSVPDKDNIEHAYAASYINPANGHTQVYFGLDRYANNGDAFVGFWFYKNGIAKVAGGTFDGQHAVGDLLVLSDFTNGGGTAEISLFEWVGTGGDVNGTLHLLAQGNECTSSPQADKACATTNASPFIPSWSYEAKANNVPAGQIPAFSFFEGGIDLTDLYGSEPPCFSGFLGETRASQSVDAILKDFALGNFNTCEPPALSTNVRQNGTNLGSVGVINKGESVYDHVAATGNNGTVTGSVDFYLCGPSASAQGCATGGTKVGSTKTLAGGAADSDSVTPATTGTYCFRAEYTPDASGSNKYVVTTHTNSTTECFQVIPASISLDKVADASSVSAGDQIGFTLTLTSTGPGTAYGVKVSDTLPTTAGTSWTIDAATSSSGWDISGGVLSYGGAGGATMANGASTHVHITSPTTSASCGVVNNTGNATTTNDGTAQDSASVTVLCPDIHVDKTADNSPISAGDTASFTMTVSNAGPGIARNVTLTDLLPSGVTWSDNSPFCSIASSVLTCSFGDLASGASAAVTISGTTDKSDCGVIPNTASVAASNESAADAADNSDSAAITVNCAQITIAKTADTGTVSAGDQIGFTVTVTNNGAGKAYDVSVSDLLPAGFTWTISPASAGWAINGAYLTYYAAQMASSGTSSVHIVATSDAADCGVVTNTAYVTTSNDGSGSASDHVTILCPDIHVDKSADNSPISAGDTASYTITVTNDGKGIARDVTLADVLPAGITWSDNSDACTIADGTLSCDFGDLESGASASVTVSGTTSAAVCGNLPNTATAAASNESAEDAQDNSDSATIVVNCPDIHVQKDAVEGTISAGDTAQFTITVSNAGPGTAYGVNLSDTLPGGLTWFENSDACSISAGVLSCSFGTLAMGASASVTVSAVTTPANCSVLENTASVAASNESGPDALDNSDGAEITVLCPDVKIEKTAAKSPISAGDTASYTITVTNIGKGIARDVTISDPLPSGVNWTDDSDSCDIADGTLSCTLGDMAPEATFSVTVSGSTDAANCGTLPNTATTAADNEPSSALGNNQASATITVDCPDILITKTAVQPTVNAGDQIGFDVSVSNNGKGAAYAVTVNDPLPTTAGLSWSIDAANSSDGWSIVDGALVYGPAALAAGDEIHVRVVSDTTAASCSVIDNTADLTWQGGSDNDSDSVTVLCPDVHVDKTASNGTINAGDEASFTMTVTNDGKGIARNVTLNDPLPSGVEWTENNAWCEITDGTLSCDFGDMDPGDSHSVTVSGTAPAAACGSLDNLASVAADNESAADAQDNTDGASITVQCPDVHVDKSAANATINAGDDASFTMTVTNDGKGTAYDVTLDDVLPSGAAWSTDTSGCAITDGTLHCDFGDLASGASASVTVSGPTTAASCGVIENLASVAAANESAADAEDNTDSASITVQCPDVHVDKSAAQGTILAGQTASFSITASNDGKGTAYDVVISDELPAGLEWTTDTDGCSITDGTLTCVVGDLAAGDTFTATVSAPTTTEACGVIDNTATVSAANESEADATDNSDSASIAVQCASISLVKTAGEAPDGTILRVPVPGNVVFTYVVTNTGTAALQDVTLVDDNATPANTADDITVVCPKLTLEPGESMTCHATLPVTIGTRVNIATVTANPVINPDATVSDTDDAVVQVPEPERTPRPTPRLTPPPTSTLDGTPAGPAGNGLLLVLVAIAGLMLALGYLVPAQAKVRRRNGRS